jgi:Na+/citrate or Na+/malate symporter
MLRLSGWLIGFAMKMYPVESFVVMACHSRVGGVGGVASFSPCNRMGQISFSQVSTQIDGVSMLVSAMFLLKLSRQFDGLTMPDEARLNRSPGIRLLRRHQGRII